MKVVFDTNILISGFLTVTGISQHVFSMALRRHTVILSDYILQEFEQKLIEKLGLSENRVRPAVDFLRRRAVIFKVTPNPKIQFSDKKDIPLLSLVEASGAHYFVTGDKQLLGIKKFGLTLILSLREALEIL